MPRGERLPGWYLARRAEELPLRELWVPSKDDMMEMLALEGRIAEMRARAAENEGRKMQAISIRADFKRRKREMVGIFRRAAAARGREDGCQVQDIPQKARGIVEARKAPKVVAKTLKAEEAAHRGAIVVRKGSPLDWGIRGGLGHHNGAQ